MSTTKHRLFTVAEYMRLDDGKRYEVIDGELLLTPSPFTPHEDARGELVARLFSHIRRRRLGKLYFAPYDVVLSPYDVVQPDILFVSRQRAGVIEEICKGPPDLAVEVLSPSTRTRDLARKRALYARSGVPHYWIVDPRVREIVELVLEGGEYRERTRRRTGAFRPALFPGLAIPVAAVFSQP